MDFKYKKWIWLGAIAVVVVLADQGTKKWVSAALAKPARGLYPPPCNADGPVSEREILKPVKMKTVIEGYWDFRYVENCGGAFGLFSRQRESFRRPFFYVTSVIASLFLLYLFIRLKPSETILLAAFSVILGGAVGNVIDRVSLGYVVDFIEWHIREKARWPTFNIADVGITVGLVLILFDSFFLASKREKKEKQEQKKREKTEKKEKKGKEPTE
ncbi:MAG: signal peptidase II [Pseudomonadota bacterium]